MTLTLYNILDNIQFTKITSNSKELEAGCLFIAIKGGKFDGHDFIDEAIAKGAKAIIATKNVGTKSVPIIYVDDILDAMAYLASKFYPNKLKGIVAVTGTNGKTSTVHFVREILSFLGKKAATIGTLGVLSDEYSFETGFTSPDAVMLNKQLQILSEKGIEYVALEASSHGIEQKRVKYIDFVAAAFTNFTQDHLDYHGTFENYFAAKAGLFNELLPAESNAILNRDIPEYERLSEICKKRNISVLDYGYDAEKLKLVSIDKDIVKIKYLGNEYQFKVNLIGDFQVYNLLTAMGLVLSLGFDFADILKAAPKVKSVPGRMEIVANNKGLRVLVDYSHTPDALEKAILELRKLEPSKLIVVFGCGGDRDRVKRKIMGEIADKYADIVIVTDDNPRSEDPEAIRNEILQGVSRATSIGDRKEAIKKAIGMMDEQDVVLIAGKGHEKTQTYGSNILPFDDVKVAFDVLN